MAITVVFQWIGSDVKIKSRGNISGTICLFHQRSEGFPAAFFKNQIQSVGWMLPTRQGCNQPLYDGMYGQQYSTT